jgi:hypothetical protein
MENNLPYRTRAKRFGGVLGREEDYVVPWGCKCPIGDDIILVDLPSPVPRCKVERRALLNREPASIIFNKPLRQKPERGGSVLYLPSAIKNCTIGSIQFKKV